MEKIHDGTVLSKVKELIASNKYFDILDSKEFYFERCKDVLNEINSFRFKSIDNSSIYKKIIDDFKLKELPYNKYISLLKKRK